MASRGASPANVNQRSKPQSGAERRRPAALVATQLQTALAHRTWSIPAPVNEKTVRRQCHAFFVTRGCGAIAFGEEIETKLNGPAIVWLPGSAHAYFRLLAGSDGFSLTGDEDFVLRTAGDIPLASILRPMLARVILVAAEKISPYLGDLRAAFEALVRESRDQGPAASVLMNLQLSVILVHLWRACGCDLALPSAGGAGAGTVLRLHQLIELHYRENLRIDRYASMLGVTRAHLHQACIAVTGRTPLALIHDRLIEEAKLKLSETQLPVEQVGYSLGFRDPAYFNRFFKRLTLQSPASYRSASLTARPAEAPAPFADW